MDARSAHKFHLHNRSRYRGGVEWPRTVEELLAEQERLARASPPPWRGDPEWIAGCVVVFARGGAGPGEAGDPGFAAAALFHRRELAATSVISGAAPYAFAPGLLALREGPLLAAAVAGLPRRPDVLLANATGRDHARGAGLALHLGALLDLPTVGITNRPLVAAGPPPDAARGATSPLLLDGEPVAAWLRTATAARPVVVHAAWRTDLRTAIDVVLATGIGARTPGPIREARRAARLARAAAD